MQIKRISLAEKGWVIHLFNKYRMFYKQMADMALADKYITERIKNNESIIFVAIDVVNGEQVSLGFTQLYPKYSSVSAAKNWILNDLYVESTHRKQGIGEALIKAAMTFAKADGANYLELETAVDNYTAQSLYEAIGFNKQAPEEGYFTYRIPV